MRLFDKLTRSKSDNGLLSDDLSDTLQHAEMLGKKKFLRRLYVDFYRMLQAAVDGTEGRVIVELGSGGGFIQEIIPNAITSDILPLPTVDKVFSACQMPFENGTVDGIVMINVLHHIPEVRLFFREVVRCLKSGGRIAMIEPANTLWGKFIYTHFHHEIFDPQGGWTFASEGPLSSANGALPWILFHRDRALFQKEFPELSLVQTRYHTPLRYLLSGGFTLPAMVPSWTYPAIKGLETILSPLNSQIGLFESIVLSRK